MEDRILASSGLLEIYVLCHPGRSIQVHATPIHAWGGLVTGGYPASTGGSGVRQEGFGR